MDKKSAPTSLYRDRRSFAKIPDVMDVPNLIAIQTESFDWFKNEGLAQAFADVCPIENNTGDMCVEFGKHEFGEPKYTVDECKEKDVTYQAPLFVEIRFINRETGEIKEQEVFMGDFPLMTPRGTFIINGTERVVVSQLVRSPGVYFASERDKTSDKTIYNAKVIPSRGAWLEFETDKRDLLSVRIDRKRKQPATLLVRALGLAETREEIIELLGSSEMVLRTLDRDPATTKEESLIELYKRFRPGEPPTIDSARTLLDGLFFNPQRYDLAKVGRYKMDKKLGFTPEENDSSTLTNEDIIRTMRYIIGLHNGDEGFVTDDIDHFGNRRIRSVGELIQNQFRIGLSRMERVVRERMSMQEPDEITPQSLVNIRPIVAAIKEFFGSSQLSQFMDQSNPAAGITHKRRLSALGPGGLSRERAGFEVRDVHTSHYGRMCPIETPEGPNIGLIGSLATYGRINPYGFIETPYRRVIDGKVTDEIDYLTADEEENFTIAQANDLFDLETREFGYTDEDGVFHKSARVLARTTDTNGVFGEAMDVPPEMVNYMDVSPRQMTSVATSLIPFLEHDDANRALMGSNMQRQAVPLLRPSAPLVGTGIEHRIAVDSGEILVAQRPGVVDYVDGQTIIILNDDGEYDEYLIPKFQRSNQSGCINHRPIVRKGDEVCGRRRAGRRPVLRRRRAGARPEPHDRLHAVGRLQLRGRYHRVRARRGRGPANLHPHLRVRGGRPRHEAGPRGDHPRDPQHLRGHDFRFGRRRHHPRGRRGVPGRRAGGQGHPEGRDRAHRRGALASRHLRREGPRGARYVASRCPTAPAAASSASTAPPARLAMIWPPA